MSPQSHILTFDHMLSSFLLSRPGLDAPGKIDDSLNAIFSASAKPTVAASSSIGDKIIRESHSPVSSKRKRKQEKNDEPKHSSKRQKKDNEITKGLENLHLKQSDGALKRSKKAKVIEEDDDDRGEGSSARMVSSDESEDEPVPVQPKREKKHKKMASKDVGGDIRRGHDAKQDSEESAEEDGPLVHESISGHTLGSASTRKTVHYVPEGETPTQRDERTVFVGNLPMEILTKKSMQKALKRHLLSCMPSPPEPGTKIESIRFRSVAFKAPTNPLALKDGESRPDSKPRKQERAAAWKTTQKDEEETAANGTKPKEYLTPAEKKRIAFIKGEFHEQGDSVNAFVVLAHPDPSKEQAMQTLMEPTAVAALIVEKMNRTKFEGRTLRVDRVGQSAKVVTKDTSKTIFVGNLDFAAKEEELRTFFETLLTTEMGPATSNIDNDTEEDTSSDDGSDEGHISSTQQPQWVHDVRMIRDEGTQLGKGFAYVRFAESTCVDEILAMEPVKLKFAKRKLRVNRYSTKGDNNTSKSGKKGNVDSKHPSKGGKRTPNGATKESPKKHRGDPLLGDRLKGLSKEERKDVKKNDANRLARRMEKKKARSALEKSLSNPAKERVRVRKLKTVAGNKGSKRKPNKQA